MYFKNPRNINVFVISELSKMAC